MQDPDIFPKRLKEARDMRELTQTELGAKASLPSTSIAHFEAGKRKPSFDNLRKLAEALEVTTDYLLGRMDKPSMSESASEVIFRDFERMTEYDKEIVKVFIKMMADKRKESDKKP